MKFMGFQFDGLEKSQFTDPPAAHDVGGVLCVGARRLPRLQPHAAWCMRHVAWAWPWHRTVGDGYAGYADPSGACVYLGTVSPVRCGHQIATHSYAPLLRLARSGRLHEKYRHHRHRPASGTASPAATRRGKPRAESAPRPPHIGDRVLQYQYISIRTYDAIRPTYNITTSESRISHSMLSTRSDVV